MTALSDLILKHKGTSLELEEEIKKWVQEKLDTISSVPEWLLFELLLEDAKEFLGGTDHNNLWKDVDMIIKKWGSKQRVS